MIRTYSLAEVAEAFGIDKMADPERWLMRRLRSGQIRGRKIARQWRFTEQDIQDALDTFASTPEPQNTHVDTPTFGLTPASLRRRAS